MPRFRIAGLNEDVVRRLLPFLADVFDRGGNEPLCLCLYGSAITRDYAPGRSDINTLFIYEKLDRHTLENLFPIYWPHMRHLVAAPLLLPRDHLRSAADVQPIQLLDLKLVHRCLFGPDLLEDVRVRRADLRLECEREARRLFLALQRCLIVTGGEPAELREQLRQVARSYLPLFRGILFLLGRRLPTDRVETVLRAGAALQLDTAPVQRAFDLLAQGVRVDLDDLRAAYVDLYGFVEKVVDRLDDLEAPRGGQAGPRPGTTTGPGARRDP